MKTREITEKYQIDKDQFEIFLIRKEKKFREGLLGTIVDDTDVESYVAEYLDYERTKSQRKLLAEQERVLREREEQEQREAARLEEQRKNAAMAQMLISSGFNFDGYKIVKYSGYISGDDATQIPRSGVFGGKNGENLTQALVRIRRQALTELKEAAYNLGCNAVIGVDFDYITLEPETANITGGTLYEPYIICVTANGNAVVIEKLED